MNKNQISHLLEEIATLLELQEDTNRFEIRAYQNAARTVATLDGDIEQMAREGQLKGTPGLGPAIIKKIEEAVTTGHITFYEQLRTNTPAVKLEMLRIPGVGPKKVSTLYKDLSLTSIADLEQACKDDRIAHLPGFGKKTQDKILQGIAFLTQHSGRFLYPVAEEEAEQIRAALANRPEIVRLQIAGSLRRRRETVKDIDMVASVSDEAGDEVRRGLMDFFTSQPSVQAITGKGDTKSSVMLGSGIGMDLRVVSDSQFPYTLHHFSGSKEHHIALRRRALSKHITINDYGMFKIGDGQQELIPCHDEADMYRALGMQYIEPEMREDMGEIEAAAKNELPELVQPGDLKGALHVHSTWSDGQNTLREMAEGCIALGFQYLGISDHSQAAAYAGGLTPDDVKRQHEEIDRLNEEFGDRLKIFKGTECDILKDGVMDFPDEVLSSFDFVVASIHSSFNQNRAEQTQRMIRAIENPYVTIIGHPTGRLLLGRAGYELDHDAILEAAARHGVCIEINAHPSRLDLDWHYLHRARDKGIKIPIDSDAHTLAGLKDMRYGIGVARKGWLRAQDVLNTLTREELSQFFQKKRSLALK